ncbi:MAG: MinD/ParA family protein, partial [Phycisphaeraceae bacterium]|nr:MinD/ParA family protein [Phycisphaeraceae bacterium]
MILSDQAQALRALVAESDARTEPDPAGSSAARSQASDPVCRARIIAVTSGKGGVGKSNFSVNLAICLRQLGDRVVLVDADLGTANADVLCNLQPRYTLTDVVDGRMSMEDILIEAPGGFLLLPGASGLAQMAAMNDDQRSQVIRQLRCLDQHADVIVIDTGAGVGPNVLGFALCADEVVVVTTPEPPAMADAYAVIKALQRMRQRLDLRLVVNMAHQAEEGPEVFERMDNVCRRFLSLSLRYGGMVPHDMALALAVRHRCP